MKVGIFLGAGASASEGAPTQDNLFRDYFILCRDGENFGHPEMEAQLKNYFDFMFGIDVTSNNLESMKFPTFEEAMGLLDLAEIRNESFKKISGLNISTKSGKLRFIRFYLKLLMAKSIHEKLKKRGQVHRRLIKNLNELGKLKNTYFISTNYDILIDNALTDLYDMGVSLDYGVDFTNFDELNEWKRPVEPSVKLFKLHGSLNWLHCPTCNNLRLTPREKGVIKLLIEANNYLSKHGGCKICKTIYSPIIVPPTFYKDFSNVFLNIVWNKAEQQLLQTEHLIFCGYSFQDADMHIKYLIKRIQKNRVKGPLKISIVNEHKRKSESERQEEKYRFGRFLGLINYTSISFEEFSLHPETLIK